VDLVIWNEDHGGYRQLLQEQIVGLIAAASTANLAGPARRYFRKSCRADIKRGSHVVSRPSPAPLFPTLAARSPIR
jgi:hypothetical protein